MLNDVKISIVFPIYNEEKNLDFLLKEWDDLLKKNEIIYEFVLAEDGSTDQTKNIIKNLKKKYNINDQSVLERTGYGPAVIRGISNSNYEYFLCCDSDGQISPTSLDSLVKLPGENEFLIGYRQPREDPFLRKIYSFFFKILHKVLFYSSIKDPSCPFVLGKVEEFKKLPQFKLLLMKEGFWWGFTAICKKYKIQLIEKKIFHRKRFFGKSDIYKIHKVPLVAIRNIIGLFKIKFF
tara:strand:- start:571 stop:1278 length:708 start_codon:yes stop_codon:yes gene_type:complete